MIYIGVFDFQDHGLGKIWNSVIRIVEASIALTGTVALVSESVTWNF
jgi:hypothetical protein